MSRLPYIYTKAPLSQPGLSSRYRDEQECSRIRYEEAISADMVSGLYDTRDKSESLAYRLAHSHPSSEGFSFCLIVLLLKQEFNAQAKAVPRLPCINACG